MSYTSRTIRIGELLLGGNQPIRLQSMTNTNTLDTKATVDQSIRMIEAGCELVRITAPGLKEAAHLQVIKDELSRKGYQVPLVADIHFNPGAALIAARIVEKVRINPGNYADRRSGNLKAFTEREYLDELDRVAERLRPLLQVCTEHGTAIRIGTNHGSLSPRIVDRYGDTPEGMVQSALEFTRICSSFGFHKLVLSMKSSNVRVMVAAYRMLAEKLTAENLNYPLHLGVTEAGDGEDGRMKSISGTGALLARGIGDTIRVSLTEEPEYELPVARAIAGRFQGPGADGKFQRKIRPDLQIGDECLPEKRTSDASGLIGGKNLPALVIVKDGSFFLAEENGNLLPLKNTFVRLGEKAIDPGSGQLKIPDTAIGTSVLLAEAGATSLRKVLGYLSRSRLKNPLILKSPANAENLSVLLTENSLNPGSLLLEGAGDGICLDARDFPVEDVVRLGFGLLQATRMRSSKTEFIACPSCGRTLFNIQERLQQVKLRMGHLKGLKIGVMGCIVNGPGEMADADYGYVGAGKGKVTLYKGKEPVSRGIPEEEAVEALVQLIRDNGDWAEA